MREREDQFRLKLDSILSPDIEVGEEDLVHIIDVEPVESLLQDFSDLTGFLTAIIDVKGKILVATGWSDICTKFHRIHPEMSIRCIESDTSLARKTRVGEYTEHRCFNHLRSVATPLMIAGKHVADIYTGQFFYEDDVIDKKVFEKQAERYGFNKDAYMAAFDRVPVVSHKSVKLVMDFLTKFSELVSKLGYSNLKLAKAISEQRRIEGALRESEKHFRILTSQAPIPIAISNLQSQMEYFNEKFISTFGYTIEDCPDYDTWWLKAYPDEEYREYVKEKWERELNQTMGDLVELQPDEYFITGKDGAVHIVEIFGSRIGEKFLGIVNDITERKRIEEFMIQREKLVGIGTLAAGITHEMNSPLQVITGMIGSSKRLLESGNADNEELLRRLNVIDKNAWRLAHIVRSLLDYARSTPGENAILCSLNDLVNQTLTLTEHQFKSWSNVVINTNLDENIPMTILDTNQITQVIINLLTNARDAMPDGGEISLRTSFDEMTNKIHLRVEDTGPGIPEEIQRKIFDPFFTTKPIGEGTGLGLSIVAGIIRGHHGEIKLESSSKEGTVFNISFPLVQALLSEGDRKNQGRY